MQFKELNARQGPRTDAWAIKESLLACTRTTLLHQVGQGFSDAVNTCFRFKELTEGLDEHASNQVFKQRILLPLERTAKLA